MRRLVAVAALLLLVPAGLAAQEAADVEVEVDFDGDEEVTVGAAKEKQLGGEDVEEEEVNFDDEEEAFVEPPVFPVVEPTKWLMVLPILLLLVFGLNVAWGGVKSRAKRMIWPSRTRKTRREPKGVSR